MHDGQKGGPCAQVGPPVGFGRSGPTSAAVLRTAESSKRPLPRVVKAIRWPDTPRAGYRPTHAVKLRLGASRGDPARRPHSRRGDPVGSGTSGRDPDTPSRAAHPAANVLHLVGSAGAGRNFSRSRRPTSFFTLDVRSAPRLRPRANGMSHPCRGERCRPGRSVGCRKARLGNCCGVATHRGPPGTRPPILAMDRPATSGLTSPVAFLSFAAGKRPTRGRWSRPRW